ncbi:hypothetical protein Tco_0063733, partial [Tanacetum coccineum]
ESVKIDAYIKGLSKNIKGEVTSSGPANLNEAVCMVHKLMEQKIQAKHEREMEENKRKWENFQSSNGIRGNYKDNSRYQQNNQRQGNARAMTTASIEGNTPTRQPPMCNHCFVHHTIMLVPVRFSAISVERLGTRKGHTRNHYPKKNNPQGGNASGRAYVIKDADKQGTNVVMGMFLLNNRYASILFDSGSDKSFVNTRFIHLIQ